MDPVRIRVRLQTRRQASRGINGGAVVVEHKVGGWGVGEVGALTGDRTPATQMKAACPNR